MNIGTPVVFWRVRFRVTRFNLIRSAAAAAIMAIFSPAVPAQTPPPKIYNTAKLKLAQGKPIIGATVFSPDPNMYCAMANSGFDYTWIEMQHSPLTYEDVARMIYSCRGSSAMPFIRVPDATESDIQKATDIGAL
jgi:hypothetical protein